jgi:predicted phosphodiesterase
MLEVLDPQPAAEPMFDVLIIDDEAPWRELIVETLNGLYACDMALTWEEAIEKIHACRYRLVIINWTFFKIAYGRKLLLILLDQCPGTPVVLMSGTYVGALLRLKERYPNVRDILIKVKDADPDPDRESDFVTDLLDIVPKLLTGTPAPTGPGRVPPPPPAPTRPVSPAPEAPQPAAQGVFSWLHLSDWHVGRKDKTAAWEDLKEALLKDLRAHQRDAAAQPGHLAGVAFRPNAIFITGDIAYRAAEAEYKEAEKLLQSIWEITGLGKAQTFIVPGNHDVDRSTVVDNYFYGLAYNHLVDPGLTEEEWLRALKETLRDPTLSRWIDEKFRHYQQFAENCTAAPARQLYYLQYLPVGATKVGILGLNSALMSWKDGEDRERGLWIGKPQLKDIQRSLQPEAAVHIALVHHPREALHECDSAWESLTEQCSILLHGHMHRPKAVLTQEPDHAYICLPGGSVYEQGLWHSQRYAYGQFNLGTKELDLYLRMTKPGADPLYIQDNQTYPMTGPSGHVILRLKE